MVRKEFDNLLSFLAKEYRIFAVLEKDGKLAVGETSIFSDAVLGGDLPLYGWKKLFISPKENLFDYENEKIVTAGVNILDLKSFLLYDHVFEKDIFYQKRRRKAVVIGHNFLPEMEDNIFEEKYEENILEHLKFDIFLAGISNSRFKVFSGSEKGQRILENFGYNDFQHVEFAGPICERESNEEMFKIKDKLEGKYDKNIWEKDLGKRCIACGRCAIVCPTCFCFRMDEGADNSKSRSWDSCFYRDFSEVAGGHKFLTSTAQRIFFWYYHKFVRIPDEFDFVGCVGCGRCSKACPVGIDIKKVLAKIKK